MGKKRGKVSNKHIYKRSNAKTYVKGANTKNQLAVNLSKVAATIFYPAYVAGTKLSKLVVNAKSNVQKGSNINKSKKVELNIASIQKGLEFIKPYKYYAAGAVALVAISVFGFSALSGMAERETIAETDTVKHVVSIPKPVEATEDQEETLTTFDTSTAENLALSSVSLPEFKVMSFASVKVYQLKVNGQIIANLKTEEEGYEVLEQLKGMFTEVEGSEIKEVYFSEQVELEMGHLEIIDFESYDTVEDTLAFIVKGTKEEKKHIVQKGENYWVIAQYYDISPYDLEKANPDIKPETIQIGQEISLIVPKPIISVCTVEEASYSDSIAFDVKYEETTNLYKGESKTKVNGVYGERAVVAEIIKENGREISRTILSENVLSEPQAKVVYKGTKDPPPRMGTGSLAYPSSRGPVTSEFGVWRSYRRHTGIDIGLNIGSTIKAADGGVVTFAGYSSSYGRYIIVDHGGNMTTLYAHNSSLLVAKGDKVFKGQTIAYSGNSGNSTGPHLHFEVRINGVPKNPRNYVNF